MQLVVIAQDATGAESAFPADAEGSRALYKVSEPVGREGGATGITANRQVLQAAFSPEVLEDGANSSTSCTRNTPS